MPSFYQGCVMCLGLFIAPAVWCVDDSVSDAAAHYSTQAMKQQSTVCVDYGFKIETPQFEPEAIYALLNQQINSSKDAEIARVLSEGAQAKLARDNQSDSNVPPLKNTLSSRYSVYETAEATSVVIHYEGYSAPAAHPFHSLYTVNYNTQSQSLIALPRLFRSDVALFKVLSQLSREQLLAQSLTDKAMMLNGTLPIPNNFQHWVLTQEGITLYFDEAQVAPYSDGQMSVTIATEKLSGLLSDEGRRILGVS